MEQRQAQGEQGLLSKQVTAELAAIGKQRFQDFVSAQDESPEPASETQRDLARSAALGRQFGVRVHGKINRGAFDPRGDVGISGMGHAAASNDG